MRRPFQRLDRPAVARIVATRAGRYDAWRPAAVSDERAVVRFSANITTAMVAYLAPRIRATSYETYVDQKGRSCVQVPAAHLPKVVDGLAALGAPVTVSLDYSKTTHCTTSCQRAQKTSHAECVCICGGTFHRAGEHGVELSETDGLRLIHEGKDRRVVKVPPYGTFADTQSGLVKAELDDLRNIRDQNAEMDAQMTAALLRDRI